jgi:hypothetical protein
MPAVIGLLHKAFFSWRTDQDKGLAGVAVADFHRNRVYEGGRESIFTGRGGNKRDF